VGGQWSRSVESYDITTKYVYRRPLCFTYFWFPVSTESPLLRIVFEICLAQNVYLLRFDDELLGLITQQLYSTEQSSSRKVTSLSCPLLDRMNPSVQKTYSLRCNRLTRSAPKVDKKCGFGKSDTLMWKKSKCRYQMIYADKIHVFLPSLVEICKAKVTKPLRGNKA